MKRINFLYLLSSMLLCLSFLIACSSDDSDSKNASELYVDNVSLQFTSEGGSKPVYITSNTEWSAFVSEGWLHVSSSKGNGNEEVIITATPNTSVNEKTGTVTFRTKDGTQTQSVSVTIDGIETTLNVSPITPSLLGYEGCSTSIVITATEDQNWVITGCPEWLHLSSLSGKGNTVVTLTALRANNTSSPITATLQVILGDKSVEVVVTQEGNKPLCKVTPINMVALYDQICFELEATSNVNTFRFGYYTEYQLGKYTDNEIIAELELSDSEKYNDGWIFYPGGFLPNTTYYICTIAYDADGKAGDLVKSPIKTRPVVDDDHDAIVTFSEMYYSLSGFKFTCSRDAYCETYHLIYGTTKSSYVDANRVLYAFQIDYYINNKKKHWYAESRNLEILTNYPNNHEFIYNTTTLSSVPVILAYAWGVFKNGEVSSDIRGFSFDTSKDEAPSLFKSNKVSASGKIVNRGINRKGESL